MSKAKARRIKIVFFKEIVLAPLVRARDLGLVPSGAVFKGYQEYRVQELEIASKTVTYKLEVWQVPGREVLRAVLPEAVQGSHFGPTLRALAFNLSAEGMTQPALFHFLRNVGIDISEGQIHHILMQEVPELHKASESILEAGLQESPYSSDNEQSLNDLS